MTVPNSSLRNPNLAILHLSKTVQFSRVLVACSTKLLMASPHREKVGSESDIGFLSVVVLGEGMKGEGVCVISHHCPSVLHLVCVCV